MKGIDTKFNVGETVIVFQDNTIYVGAIKSANIDVFQNTMQEQASGVRYNIVVYNGGNRDNPYIEIKGVCEKCIFINTQELIEKIEDSIDTMLRGMILESTKDYIYRSYNLSYHSRVI